MELGNGLYEMENPTLLGRLAQQPFFARLKQQRAIPEHAWVLGQAQRSMPWTIVVTEATTMMANLFLKSMSALWDDECETRECRKIIV
jgi:hypothetical protein